MIQLMNVLRWWLALVMLIHLCFVFIDNNLDELHDCNLVTLLIKIVQLPNVSKISAASLASWHCFAHSNRYSKSNINGSLKIVFVIIPYFVQKSNYSREALI